MKNHHRPTQTASRPRRGLPVAVTAVALCQLTVAAQNLIENGSFEDPVVPGDYAGHTTGQVIGSAWLVEHADVDVGVVRTYGVGSIFYPTPAGSQFCYLADNVTYSLLRQDIATPLTAGLSYELTFVQSTDYRLHPLGEVTVELAPTGGSPELTQVFSFSEYTDWTERSLLFTPAASGLYPLRLSSTPGVPGNIDDVRLVESTAVVPEPAACGLAAGLGLLGLANWRRWGRRRTTSVTPESSAALLRFLPVIAGAAVGLNHAGAQAQRADPWVTALTYQGVPGLSASGGDIGFGTDGNLYAVGSFTPDVEGNRTARVLGSGDQGANWVEVAEYLEPGSPYAHFRGFASGAVEIYAAGELYNSVGWNKTWFVRESVDGGSIWTTTDAFQPAGGNNASCGDIKVSPFTGDVYAVGCSANIGADGVIRNPSWVVRKRAANATTFVTVDSIVGSNSQIEARALGFHATAGVFVAGRVPGPYGPVWTVRRSTEGGLNWQTVDYFQSNREWLYSAAEGIAVAPDGIIYVCGYARNAKASTPTWIVRQSSDGGGTWKIVDNFAFGTLALATGLAVDRSGRLIVCGYADTTEESLWLVRRGTPEITWVKQGKKRVPVNTVSWVTSDEFQLAPGQHARANGITTDAASGDAFVTGWARDAGAVPHWMTRKLSAP